jgi:hypothetical protein
MPLNFPLLIGGLKLLISTRALDEFVQLSVSDNGIGMAEDKITSVFAMYSRSTCTYRYSFKVAIISCYSEEGWYLYKAFMFSVEKSANNYVR